MRVQHATKAPLVYVTDDEVLQWVRMRAEGVTSTAIGERWGCSSEKVRNATNRVMRADIDLCGPHVSASYW